jgi:hypothetical protein
MEVSMDRIGNAYRDDAACRDRLGKEGMDESIRKYTGFDKEGGRVSILAESPGARAHGRS